MLNVWVAIEQVYAKFATTDDGAEVVVVVVVVCKQCKIARATVLAGHPTDFGTEWTADTREVQLLRLRR